MISMPSVLRCSVSCARTSSTWSGAIRERLEDIAGSDEASFAAEHDELFLDLVEALRVSRWLAGRAQRGLPAASGARRTVYGTRGGADPDRAARYPASRSPCRILRRSPSTATSSWKSSS